MMHKSATGLYCTTNKSSIVCCFQTVRVYLDLTVAMIEMICQPCSTLYWISIALSNCCFKFVMMNSSSGLSAVFVVQQTFLSTRYCIVTVIKKLDNLSFWANSSASEVSSLCKSFNICHSLY